MSAGYFHSASSSPNGSPTASVAGGSGSFPAAAGSGSQQQQQQLSGTNYRSKFAGMPGSTSALHVHYGFKHSAPAFDPLPSDHPSVIARREARGWAQGTRLGHKPEWNGNTCTPDTGGHPRRNLMHQLSEFQAPKIVYNYRAQELPSVHKQAVPVWKSSKFTVDQANFLSKKDRSIAGHHVLGNTTMLSHAEMPVTEEPRKQELESGWNVSTALAHERASLFVKREEADYRALNRTKPILDHDRYVNPIEDVKRKMESNREEKREQRRHQQAFVAEMKREVRARRGLKPMSLSGGSGGDYYYEDDTLIGGGSSRSVQRHHPLHQNQVFKMSNIDTWWDASPPEVQETVRALQSRRQAEQDDKMKREKAEEEAARMMSQPTGLRVVAPGDVGSSSVPVSGR